MKVFDVINGINKKTITDEDIKDPQFEKEYSDFLINRHFSYFVDTCLIVNELNIRSSVDFGLTNIQKFQFLNNVIPKASRFTKWGKPMKDDTVDLIKHVYKYSTKQAIEVSRFFSESDIENLRKRVEKGGIGE